MGLLKSAIKNEASAIRMGANYIGHPSFSKVNPYGWWCEDDTYASIYPSVKAIANAFKKIRPLAIDANGKPVQKVPAVQALYHPNQLDSSVSFREKIIISKLIKRNTYLLVWRRDGNDVKPGGDITPANIAGYTFLENPAVSIVDQKTYYSIGSQQFDESEVIVIPGGTDPNNLYGGYSAGIASISWARLDDYIAAFQRGFFENGAVPAGQFIITAPTPQEFNDTVDKLQEKHRGASKNNNVTYVHRPIDQESGKPANAQVEWIPFQQTNKDIDFKNLFEQANNRIDSTFGVPASIRGVGENNNYATAKTDQQNFIRFTVDPITMDIYTQITHELNRITGGLGVAITYELDIPAIADEEKVEAETKVLEANLINTLVSQGYTLDSIVDAFELSNGYKTLVQGITKKTNIENDQDDVDEGNEVDDSPNPAEIDGVTPIKQEAAKRTNPKANNAVTNYDKLFSAARKSMKRQVDDAVDEITEADITNEYNPEPTLDDENQFIDDMMAVIAVILAESGAEQYINGKELMSDFGIDLPEEYTLPEAADDRYRSYLKKVAGSYLNDTADSIRKVLATAKEDGLTVAETKKALRNIMNTDEYRITRMAVTELNRSQAVGSIESMRDIQDRTGVRLQKGLAHHSSDTPCEFCAVLLNRWVNVDQEFIIQGETVIGADGGMYLNNFAANEGYDIHPNGHCSPQYRVAV